MATSATPRGTSTCRRVFATYHVDDLDVLYNKGDQWQIPDNVGAHGSGPHVRLLRHLRLPEEQKEEFILMLPFVPNGTQEHGRWLGARSDAAELRQVGGLPASQASESIYGPSQVEAAINQDPQVSAQLTLWNQRGSTVIMGNLLVVPIVDSLIYIQPLYLQSEADQAAAGQAGGGLLRAAPGASRSAATRGSSSS